MILCVFVCVLLGKRGTCDGVGWFSAYFLLPFLFAVFFHIPLSINHVIVFFC